MRNGAEGGGGLSHVKGKKVEERPIVMGGISLKYVLTGLNQDKFHSKHQKLWCRQGG